MTTQDFERLKAICEKEGFTIESYCGGKTAIVGVKDPWEGVEFVQEKDTLKIYKVGHFHNSQVWVFSDVEWIWKDNCKPSTESAYVEQLKKEAFERFGEIKEGHMFDLSCFYGDGIKPDKIDECEFYYNKKHDLLFLGSVCLYDQGQWAERVKERIKVYHRIVNHFCDGIEIKFLTGYIDNPADVARFLNIQLEQYLNKEIK